MIEVPFEEWQWEEELLVFSLEEVGLGKVCRLDDVQLEDNKSVLELLI